MTYKVVIENRQKTFPMQGLNELLESQYWNARAKKFQNQVKADGDKVCRLAIQKYMRGVKIDKPIVCHIHKYVKDKKHDRGNLNSAIEKSFLDALQQRNVIKNDGFDDVMDSVFYTEIDKNNPRIEVIIEEMEG